jgi:hypothetical protein
METVFDNGTCITSTGIGQLTVGGVITATVLRPRSLTEILQEYERRLAESERRVVALESVWLHLWLRDCVTVKPLCDLVCSYTGAAVS